VFIVAFDEYNTAASALDYAIDSNPFPNTRFISRQFLTQMYLFDEFPLRVPSIYPMYDV
jgi:hypothetical protein